MNPLVVLMGLLVLAYAGSFLVSGRTIRGFGLPSGAEYVLLGFFLGPHALSLLEGSMLSGFDPIAGVAVGWLALLVGLDWGRQGEGRTSAPRLLGSAIVSLFSAALVAAPVWYVVTRLTTITGADRVILVGGIALSCAETTRHAVRWVVERHQAHGPVSDLIHDLAQNDDVVPLLGAAALFALTTPAKLPFAIGLWGWTGITLGLGVVLGALAALLLGRDFRHDESWGVLLGMSILGIGTTTRLGLASISTMFVMGLTVSALSRHRLAVRALVEPTDRPVLHPALLLAGAHVDPRASPQLPFLVLFALAARMAAKWLVGLGVQAVSKPARKAGPGLGMGLLSSGALSITVGLAFALRFPGTVGDSVLAVAASATVLGELIGPSALRFALKQASEVVPSPDAAASGASSTDVDPNAPPGVPS
jgi:Kef-type K+ transport system membrane component KefB